MFLLAGCADGPNGASSPTAPPTALPGTDPADSPVETVPPALAGDPEMVEPQEDLEAVEPHPWDEVFVLNEGRGIELRWTSPPCRLLSHIEVDYSDEVVTLTLFLGQVDAEAPCDDALVYRGRRRGLPEPVGTRSLADGAEL